ncbi:hypothetical protein H0H92_000750, partial [Tricholoma furcatifolium]
MEHYVKAFYPNRINRLRSLTVMCFPHIINICVQHVLRAIDDQDPSVDDEHPDEYDDEEYEEGDDLRPAPTQKTLLWKLRGFIRTMRASGL